MTPETALSLLGLRLGAQPAEIKRAYRRLAKQMHPDLFQDPARKLEAEEQFKRLRAAVDVLAAGYSAPSGNGGTASSTTAPFDARDIYGSTYAYSFAQRTPLARSPLVGCLFAMALPLGAGLSFEEGGISGLSLYVLAVAVAAMLVWLSYRAVLAVHRWLGRWW